MVIYARQVVEHGTVPEIFADPQHPHPRALLGTVPSVTGPRERRLRTIEGQPPILGAAPTTCPFVPRCAHAFNRCRVENPPRIPVGSRHDVACWWDPATDEPRHV
jgi:peptide/nickel transport system ATP-binding protein/oligopeptide transport system ATP-binding protein